MNDLEISGQSRDLWSISWYRIDLVMSGWISDRWLETRFLLRYASEYVKILA